MIDITDDIISNPTEYSNFCSDIQEKLIFDTCDQLVALINQIQEREVAIQDFLVKYTKKNTDYYSVKNQWIQYCQFVCPNDDFNESDNYTDIDTDNYFLSNTYDEDLYNSQYIPDLNTITRSDDIQTYFQQTNKLNNSVILNLQQKMNMLSNIIESIKKIL